MSATPAPTASNVSNGRTRVPAGNTSILMRPPLTVPTVAGFPAQLPVPECSRLRPLLMMILRPSKCLAASWLFLPRAVSLFLLHHLHDSIIDGRQNRSGDAQCPSRCSVQVFGRRQPRSNHAHWRPASRSASPPAARAENGQTMEPRYRQKPDELAQSHACSAEPGDCTTPLQEMEHCASQQIWRPMSLLGHSRHSRYPGVSGLPPRAERAG